MASGKSTVGKLLAEMLGFEFIDTDKALVQLNGIPVNEIFEGKGEQEFRSEEAKILQFSTELDKVVISTGGGMPCSGNNLSKMLATGLTVYLESETTVLASRILKDQSIRPLHQEKDLKTLLHSIERKLTERKKYYKEAHLTMDGNKPSSKLAAELYAKILGDQ